MFKTYELMFTAYEHMFKTYELVFITYEHRFLGAKKQNS